MSDDVDEVPSEERYQVGRKTEKKFYEFARIMQTQSGRLLGPEQLEYAYYWLEKFVGQGVFRFAMEHENKCRIVLARKGQNHRCAWVYVALVIEDENEYLMTDCLEIKSRRDFELAP